MKTSTIVVWIIIVILIIGGVWWYVSSESSSVQPVTTSTTSTTVNPATTAPAAVATVSATSSITTGAFLVATNNMTLYTYGKDTTGVSNCTGSCAASWPPYSVSSGDTLVAGPNVGGKLGTLVRSDGSIQVTYNGQPLYFWIHDVKPGDVMGNGVGGFAVAKP